MFHDGWEMVGESNSLSDMKTYSIALSVRGTTAKQQAKRRRGVQLRDRERALVSGHLWEAFIRIWYVIKVVNRNKWGKRNRGVKRYKTLLRNRKVISRRIHGLKVKDKTNQVNKKCRSKEKTSSKEQDIGKKFNEHKN